MVLCEVLSSDWCFLVITVSLCYDVSTDNVQYKSHSCFYHFNGFYVFLMLVYMLQQY